MGRSWLACLLIVFSPPVSAGTILERVLNRLHVEGLFANVAQSGLFDGPPTEVIADISLVASLGPTVTGDILARAAPKIQFHDFTALGIGATNSGDLVLGVGLAGVGDPQSVGQPGILLSQLSGSSILLGTNMQHTLAHTTDNLGGIIASAALLHVETLGGIRDQTHVVLNAAENASRVTARLQTSLNGVSADIRNLTSTAIGAVNTGITRIIGR